MSNSITLTIDSRLECVFLLGLAVRGICQAYPLEQDDVDALELAVCEAANNAIKHAYAGRPNGTVQVTLANADGKLDIYIIDSGSPMPNKNIMFDDLPTPMSIEDLPEGGMGLFLIRKAADNLDYRSEDGFNALIIRKVLTS